MKKLFIIPSLLLSALLCGCADLKYNEVSTYDEEWTLSSRFNGVQKLVTNVYSYLDYDYGNNYDGAMRASATDESDYVWPTSSIHTFYNGAWSAINYNSSTWSQCYTAIRAANYFLENATELTFDEFKHNTDYYSYMQKYKYFPYEVRFLRAYYYFNLVREYGDVPLVTKVLTPEEANTVKRDPQAQIFDFIVKECDEIIDKLPDSYADEESAETGRINKACVLALKARTLLYKASPLFNVNNDMTLWREAALANLKVIESCKNWGIKLGKYVDLWGSNAYKNTEIILRRPVGDQNSFEAYNFPISVEGGKSGNCPTQNLVDAYLMKSGKAWDEEGSGYNESDPYANRDPRFGMSIIKNGDKNWPSYNNVPIETFMGGNSGQPLLGATTTGYYLKKLCDASVDLRPNSSSKKKHTWPIFRLGEFYLNYAEAAFHALNNNASISDDELTMTPADAVNVIRDRSDVKMPHINEDEDFEEQYLRERMVELAFENHRYWDVRRWKKGTDFFTNIVMMQITKKSDGSYSYERVVKKRLWDDKMYFSPIPDAEIRKNKNLEQNPGW